MRGVDWGAYLRKEVEPPFAPGESDNFDHRYVNADMDESGGNLVPNGLFAGYYYDLDMISESMKTGSVSKDLLYMVYLVIMKIAVRHCSCCPKLTLDSNQ